MFEKYVVNYIRSTFYVACVIDRVCLTAALKFENIPSRGGQ